MLDHKALDCCDGTKFIAGSLKSSCYSEIYSGVRAIIVMICVVSTFQLFRLKPSIQSLRVKISRLKTCW